jgi:UDP-3-O-[3-hydroxymyristoyl] glucosamine N-acyltransferase
MVILGAGGHANEVLDVLSASYPPAELFLFDDTGADTRILSHRFSRLLRSVQQIEEVFRNNPAFCVAVGKPEIRQKLTELGLRHGGQPANALAQTAYVSPVAETGLGLNIMHMAYISPGATIEDGVLINAGALIHHDVIVGRYTEISPGVVLLGGA